MWVAVFYIGAAAHLGGRRLAELALELETVVTTGELMLEVVAVLVMHVLMLGCRIPAGFSPTWAISAITHPSINNRIV